MFLSSTGKKQNKHELIVFVRLKQMYTASVSKYSHNSVLVFNHISKDAYILFTLLTLVCQVLEELSII